MKTFKVVVIGDASVGKSSLIHRITEGEFWRSAPTIGCNFRKYVAQSTFNEDVSLEIWDTAGEERYHSIMSMYYRHADAVIMLYDVTAPRTFLNVQQYWIDQVKTYCNEPLLFLIGNKTDLVQNAQIIMPETVVQKWARENDATHLECSAKSEEGISEMVTTLVDKLIEHHQPKEQNNIQLEEFSYMSYCKC